MECIKAEKALMEKEALEDILQKTVAALYGEQTTLTDIHVEPSAEATFYGIDIITLGLENRPELRIVRKNFSSYHYEKDRMAERRDREVFVYRDLLPGSGLGTAEYYGSVHDETKCNYWLFLEYVEGTTVDYCKFETWVSATAWLGKFHAFFSKRINELETIDVLGRHESDYFLAVADQAMFAVTEVSLALGRRIEPIVRDYQAAVENMIRQPRTLVHGAYLPGQVLYNNRSQPARICPLDWELAAIGSGGYDLSCIVDGFEGPQLAHLLDAYREEASCNGLTVISDDSMIQILGCFRLHRRLNWLMKSVDRRYPDQTVEKLVSDAEALARQVL